MFSAARMAWRSTDSKVRLPMWGVTMMLSISRKGWSGAHGLLVEDIGAIAGELAGSCRRRPCLVR